MSLNIRRAKIDDQSSCARLMLECFDRVYFETPAVYQQYVNEYTRGIFVAELDNKIVGMVSYLLWSRNRNKTTATIQNLCITSEYRNKGIATLLIKILIQNLQKHCDIIEVSDGSGGITGKILSKFQFQCDVQWPINYSIEANKIAL